MSRSFLILTTLPPHVPNDPSERPAILAARREEALELRAIADAAARSTAGPAEPGADRRLFLGWVDRIGRAHFWPGLLR